MSIGDNKLVVTIIDENGSKQFYAHKFIKKAILYLIIALIAIIFSSFLLMNLLMDKLEAIKAKKDSTMQDYKSVYMINLDLREQIQDRT